MSGSDPFSPSDSYHATAGGERPSDNRSLGEIVGAIAGDLTTLVRAELDLAKTELKREATHAGKGAGLLGGAGVTGLLALVFASLALMFVLDNWMPIGLAALIVAVIWGVVAAVLASRGKKELKQPMPPLEATQRTLKEDVQWAKAQRGS